MIKGNDEDITTSRTEHGFLQEIVGKTPQSLHNF